MVFQLTIKHWHAVAEWTWSEGDDDVCGICRTAHDGCAPDVKYPGDDSPVVWGACGHAFHLQCIQKWLSSSSEQSADQSCPMCRRPWSYQGAAGEEQELVDGEQVPSSHNGSDPNEQQENDDGDDEEEDEDEQDEAEEDEEELGQRFLGNDLFSDEDHLSGELSLRGEDELAGEAADAGNEDADARSADSEDEAMGAAAVGMHEVRRRRRRPAHMAHSMEIGSAEGSRLAQHAGPVQGPHGLFAFAESGPHGDVSDEEMESSTRRAMAWEHGAAQGTGAAGGPNAAAGHAASTPPGPRTRASYGARVGEGGMRRLDLELTDGF